MNQSRLFGGHSRLELAALAGILILAAALRLGAPGITEFKGDEANLARLALNLARGRSLPLLGITSSVGVPNPPINVYLFAIPYLVDDSGIAATLFVGLLNVIAVGLTWAVARRMFGRTAAIVAGVLYAAAPWAAIFSRKIWAQDLLPVFVVATVLTGLLGYREGKRWAQIAHWPLLALTVQIHYSAFTLIPLSLLMLVLWGRDKKLKPLVSSAAIGLGIALLTGAPVLIGVIRAGLLTPDRVGAAIGAEAQRQMTVDATALGYAWLLVAGTQIHALAGPDQFRHYLATVPNAYPLFHLIPIGVVLTAAWLIRQETRSRKSSVGPDLRPAYTAPPGTRGGENLILVLWLLLPIFAFTWQWTPVQLHYLIPMMPAAYILCGAGFDALLRWLRSPRIRQGVLIGGGLLIGVIVTLQVVMFVGLLGFLDTHTTPGGFGTPLRLLLDIRAAILDRQPSDVLIVSTGDTPAYDQEPAVWGVLLDRVPDERAINGTRTAVVPAGDALELVLLAPSLVNGPLGGYWSREGGTVFPQRPGDSPYVLRPVDGSTLAALITPIEPVHFANGATLTGYAVQEHTILLAWELNGPAGRDYQAFVHLLDAAGNRVFQVDRTAWPGRYWRAGDRLYLWFDVSLPPEAVTLRTGMYTFDGETYTNVDVLDVAGNPQGQWAEIPLGN